MGYGNHNYQDENPQRRNRQDSNQQANRFSEHDPYGYAPGGYGQVNYNQEDERDHFRNAGGDQGNQYGNSPYGHGQTQPYRGRPSGANYGNANQRQEDRGYRDLPQEPYGQYGNIKYGGGYAQGRQFSPYVGGGYGEGNRQGPWPEDPNRQGGYQPQYHPYGSGQQWPADHYTVQQNEPYRGRGREEHRDWWDRATDKIASWFGDEQGDRRNQAGRVSGPHRGKGPRGYQRSDERIRDDINDRLYDDPFVDASDIEVQVTNGEVVLSGTIDSKEAKRRAEDIAEYVSGVRNVENHLKVIRNVPASGSQPKEAQRGDRDEKRNDDSWF